MHPPTTTPYNPNNNCTNTLNNNNMMFVSRVICSARLTWMNAVG